MSRAVTIGELAQAGVLEFGDGYRTRKDQLDEAGFRILRAADVRDGYAHLDGDDFVAIEQAAKIGAKAAREGDIVLTTKGSVGRVAMVPALGEAVVYSPQLCYFRVRATDVLDARFLRYWLRSPQFQQQSSYLQGNTDMAPYISLRDLASTRMVLPTVDEQRRAGELLGALDDKIEANRKLAATADELSRWRFKAMQVDSESVSLPLSSTARFVNGRAFTKGASGTGRVVIRIAELNSGLGGSTVWNDIEVPEEHLARPGDLLFAWSGSLTLARWFHDEAIVNQHIFKVIPKEDYPLWLVNQLVHDKLVEFQAIAADKATTMGHIQRRHLDEPVCVPPASTIGAANAAMDGLWRRALLAEVETVRLTALRNTLLPKLMSGQLRVVEARELVGS